MKKLFLIISMLMFAVTVYGEDSEFDLSQNMLTIPIVKIGNNYIYDVKLQLNNAGNFTLISYSDTQPTQPILDTCLTSLITLEKAEQLQKGMSIDQANNIIGCKGESMIGYSYGGKISAFLVWQGVSTTPYIKAVIESEGILGSAIYYP